MEFQFFCIIFPFINPGICKIKLRTLFDPSNMQKGTKIEQFFWRKIILKFSFVRWNSVGSNFLCKILTSCINFHDKWLLLMDCAWKNITHSLLKCQNPCTEAWEKLTRISHYFSLIFKPSAYHALGFWISFQCFLVCDSVRHNFLIGWSD